MTGQPGISLIRIDRPSIYGVRDSSGRGNWQFTDVAAGAAPHVPPIGRLIISDGAVRYLDARLKLSFSGSVSTDEAVADVGPRTFRLRGGGTFRDTPFTASVSGGPW